MSSNLIEEIFKCNYCGFKKYQDGPYQNPEPWNGNLCTADYLFVGSNPAYDPNEVWPSELDDITDIKRFFVKRFQCEPYKGKTVKQFNKITYWKNIVKIKKWINEIDHYISKEEDLNDVCLTEIVHCKSNKQKGVFKCAQKCFDKYFPRILENFKGHYLILVGKVAEKYLDQITASARGKTIICCRHPNARFSDNDKKEYLKNHIIKR